MINISEKLGKILPFIANTVEAETSPGSFDFIRSKAHMLRELEYCKQHNNLVGIYCSLLGNGMFLVGVENIVYGDEGVLIIFHKRDMSGHALARRTLELSEISVIVPFNNPYVPPAPRKNTVSATA